MFTRSSNTWTQQGGTLLASDTTGSRFGAAVSLSSDGNTALIGDYLDNNGAGAAWIFTRSGSTWTQLGTKMVGTGGNFANQGTSVSLSGDGNTAVIGGEDDTVSNQLIGAAWIFTRSGNTWTQQGNKLVGTGAVGEAEQGFSVALSSDGNTLVESGATDNSQAGAVWVFTRSGSTWSQMGSKLTPSDETGAAEFGYKVALSSDGRTGAFTGFKDNSNAGAAWVFAQPASTLPTVTGVSPNKLSVSGNLQTTLITGTNMTGTTAVHFGSASSPSFSAGSTSVNATIPPGSGTVDITVTTPSGTSAIAAADQFTYLSPVATHDFNGDGKSDIVWRDTSGDTAMWLMNGGTVSAGASLGNVPATWSIVGQRDFDGDGKTDLLWHDTSGNTAIWLMNGGTIASAASLGNVPTSWSIAGTGNFDGGGRGDILWHDSSGNVAIWFMNGGTIASSAFVANVPTNWSIAGSSRKGILWRDTAGDVALWLMNGETVASSVLIGTVPTSWSIVGSGDFDGDGNIDILWRDTSGNTAIWFLNSSGAITSAASLGTVPTSWSVAETGDFDGDGKSDILWHDSSGNTAIWFMNGGAVSSAASLGNVATVWSIQGAGAD